MIKSLWALALVLLILPASGSEYPLTITDSAGREVTIDAPVGGIIVLNSDAAEAVAVLGAVGKVVGISNSVKDKAISSYFPELDDLSTVGKWNNPDFEAIGELSRDESMGDIVVISYSYPDKSYGIFSIEEGLSPFENIIVLALDFFRPETMAEEITLLGAVLNKEDRAEEYVQWVESKRTQVEMAVEGKARPRAYVEWSSSGGLGSLSTMGPGSGFGVLLDMAGGENIAEGLEGDYPKVDWEWVVSEDPQVMIKRVAATDETRFGWTEDSLPLDESEEIQSRPGAESISAVQDGRAYLCHWDMMAGLDHPVGLTYLAKMLYPEADLDPQEARREYLELLGKTPTMDTTFVYPGV